MTTLSTQSIGEQKPTKQNTHTHTHAHTQPSNSYHVACSRGHGVVPPRNRPRCLEEPLINADMICKLWLCDVIAFPGRTQKQW